MTIREIYERCRAEYWSLERFQKSGWASVVHSLWENVLQPVFGDLEAADVGPKFIKAWHRTLTDTPTQANRALEVLSRLYRFGAEEELIPAVNPCRLVKGFPERKRSRVPSEDELRRLGKELEKEGAVNRRQVAFCYLLAETGARPRSIARARRDQLAVLADGTGLLVFEGKTTRATGDDESVVIPARLVRMVQALPVRDDDLLLGPVEYKRFWARITRNAGISGLWLRDFRRAFASVGLSAGVGIDPIGELLNHRSSQTTKGYARLLPAARLTAARTISSRMFQLMHK